MKFRLQEHPSVWAFLGALVLLAASFALAYIYLWKIYAVIPIPLAGIAVIVLGYSLIKDILDFEKKKNELESKEEEKHDEGRD